MAKTKRQDVFSVVGIILFVAVVGLSIWARFQGADWTPRTKQGVQALQVTLLGVCLVLVLLSFRHPLRRMNLSLFRERREVERERRRKKSHRG